MSALPPEADVKADINNVRLVPHTDIAIKLSRGGRIHTIPGEAEFAVHHVVDAGHDIAGQIDVDAALRAFGFAVGRGPGIVEPRHGPFIWSALVRAHGRGLAE
jgi:hypothetical protein